MLLSYLRLVLFAAGLLIGVQVPGFINDYAKRVEAHLIEAQAGLSGPSRRQEIYAPLFRFRYGRLFFTRRCITETPCQMPMMQRPHQTASISAHNM